MYACIRRHRAHAVHLDTDIIDFWSRIHASPNSTEAFELRSIFAHLSAVSLLSPSLFIATIRIVYSFFFFRSRYPVRI